MSEKYNVLICIYFLNNPGGILNTHEGLVAGLQALGHKVTTRQLLWRDDVDRSNSRDRRLASETLTMGVELDQELGWKFPQEMKIPYRGSANLKKWKKFANQFDLVIWQVPVPTMQAGNEGNLDWLELYDIEPKQVIYVHDGNMVDSYPWVSAIVDKLCGAAATNPCGFSTLRYLPIPRALAFSPQVDIEKRMKAADASRKRSGWCSFQTFKAWKHVDDIVRAIPHMRNKEPMVLGGGGLIYHYMTSKDKIRPEFFVNRKLDPDMLEEWKGERIWELALDHGMEYLDYVVTKERDKVLHASKFLIDPSWSIKYSKYGDHPNRVATDALIGGCALIARNLGLGMDEKGEGEFFKPDRHYKMIPWNTTPLRFAKIVDDCISMKEEERRWLVENGRKEIVPLWDYRKTAQAFIDLAEGRPAGVHSKDKEKNSKGQLLPQLKTTTKEALDGFFAGKKDRAETTLF